MVNLFKNSIHLAFNNNQYKGETMCSVSNNLGCSLKNFQISIHLFMRQLVKEQRKYCRTKSKHFGNTEVAQKHYFVVVSKINH